jgi:hypothetical protein
MLLWTVKGQACEFSVDLAGDVAFEAADDLWLGEALLGAVLEACTARAAASASTGSDLPRRRVVRSGRSTSTTRYPHNPK